MAKAPKHNGEILRIGGFVIKLPPNTYVPPVPPSSEAKALVDRLREQVAHAAADGRRLACIDLVWAPVPTWVVRTRMCKPMPGTLRFGFHGIAEKGFPVMAAFLSTSNFWLVYGDDFGRLIDRLFASDGIVDEALGKDIESMGSSMRYHTGSEHSANWVRVTRGRI